MNRNNLKKYAPEARRDFIRAVTDRASYYGLTKKKTEPVTVEGDVAIINGRPFPKKVAEQRKRLEEMVNRLGFEQVMEAVAYTWFNRLVAIRYMELHGYLDHGYRVLSHPEGDVTPEIVEHAEHLDLAGLDKQKVISLKLDGTKESELYRMLLIAQCNALHKAMPFLFEHIGDETELLLPDNLLHSDSLIRTLVKEIPEEDWQEVEIIGWLYQFYISEKKDEVIGKVVKSEDIPAATQLFTPNWIVKYLVQNSLGRQWMATYPNSPLKGQMEFYIEPAEQTPEVQEQLKAITPESLNPEELTLLDPACGSGHILVEAYDLLKAIYQERGYRAKDIPRLILEKNLFGLEIDDRAAQLAAFALMMKARADSHRIFDEPVELHVVAIQESKGLDAREITGALNQPIFKGEALPPESLFEEIDDDKAPLFSRKHLSEPGHIPQSDVAQLLDLFEHGKTFGSLIELSERLTVTLPVIAERIEAVLAHGGMLEQPAVKSLQPLVQQAAMLGTTYTFIVTNPPYMGNKNYNPLVRSFVAQHYKTAKPDLYACFMQRNRHLAKHTGMVAMITIPNWMFLSSFEAFRKWLLTNQSVDTFVHNGRGVFGSDFGSCAFILINCHLHNYQGTFKRLFDKQGSVASNEELNQRFFSNDVFHASNKSLESIAGCPIAYWATERAITAFVAYPPMSEMATPRAGMITSNNELFLRLWYEVPLPSVGFDCQSRQAAQASHKKWFPYVKGGPYRKWYGNMEYVVNWYNDGYDIRNRKDSSGRVPAHAFNEEFIFKPNVNWSVVTIGSFSVRISDGGCLFDSTGSAAFPAPCDVDYLGGFLNSIVAEHFIGLINPTVHFQAWDIAKLPVKHDDPVFIQRVTLLVEKAKQAAKDDWDACETSWNFSRLPVVDGVSTRLPEAQASADSECLHRFQQLKSAETELNHIFINAYGLDDELEAVVPDSAVTLYRPDCEEDIKRLISYAIGCMMGRYSLDKPGLIYAHSGGDGFDTSQYPTFPADADGIVPVTDFEWFEDDAANRLEDFIATAWPKEHLEENLTFIADSLGPNKGERPRETIRRYLSTGFFKHHLSMYKRRPIYWLFSSGKHRAFQCLVYLHRYNEGTLSRMRTEYVIPLSGQMSSRIDQLEGDIAAASSTSHRKKLEKERQTLIKQREELQAFDEQLRHYADQRIKLDLDDGVKVNYGKFGDLLAEVKAITGNNP